MIEASLQQFLKNNLPLFNGNIFLKDENFILSEHKKPLATVNIMPGNQELWVIGDAFRKNNQKYQLTFYMPDYYSERQIEVAVMHLIESAKDYDSDGVLKAGMNYLGVFDQLTNPSGDLLTYVSGQPGWFASPVPIIYNSNGSILSTGFTVDLVNGEIVFATAQLQSAIFYATYKCGLIDFDITDIAHVQLVDNQNNLHKYNVAVTVSTFLNIKATANKLL